MNSNQNAEISANPEARPAGVPVRKRLASTLGAKRDVSQPVHETRALPRAASRSSPVIKPAHACAQNRGVEIIMANHGCGRSAPPLEARDATSSADEVRCNEWELFTIWSFVVIGFAGLFFCAYVILAKCRGTWPL
jgi:hypothetical protein